MIRASVRFDATPLYDFGTFARDFENVVDSIAEETHQAIAPKLLSELQYYPRAATLPFVWSRNAKSNERARRYYFAAVRRGEIPTSGGRYQRTNQYAKSWRVDLQKSGGLRTISARTNYPGAKFVGGSFDRRRDFQIPGHQTTGWPRSIETVDFWFNAAQQEIRRAFDRTIEDRLGVLVTRRVNR